MIITDSSLVLSFAHLSRQAGAILHEDREWSAPADLGTLSMSVLENIRIPLSIGPASVSDSVLVRVKIEMELKGECVRCLDPASVHYETDASDIYFETAPSPGGGDLEADDFLLTGAHDMIDLEPLLHNAIATLVDERPLCGGDCQGLCDVRSEKRVDLPADHSYESINPRLMALASLLESSQREAD